MARFVVALDEMLSQMSEFYIASSSSSSFYQVWCGESWRSSEWTTDEKWNHVAPSGDSRPHWYQRKRRLGRARLGNTYYSSRCLHRYIQFNLTFLL